MSQHARMFVGRFCLALLMAPAAAIASEQVKTKRPDDSSTNVTAARPATEQPLTGVLSYARKEREYLRETVRDFTCRLIKRERIEGILQEYNYIDMKVREEQRDGGRVMPFAIYLHFLGPRNVAGRRVLFVDGQHDGKMLVRNGGRHFDYVVVDVDPQSESARRESLVPITETGFTRLLDNMITILERHRKIDPTGANTTVKRTPGVKINKRPSTLLTITHPEKQKGLEFHLANVYVDDELHVPARIEYYDWPKYSTVKPPLTAEYTYTLLEINVGLLDGDFAEGVIRGRR